MRFYEIDGKQLPSVTTVLGQMLSKPQLVPWAAKKTAEAFAGYLLDNCEAHKEFGLVVTGEDLTNAITASKKAHRTESKEAMAKGTTVHEAIEAWIVSDGLMKPEELSDPVARQGLEQFLKWGEEHHIEIISYEEQVSDGVSFAGRYDLLARIDGVLTLVDFKTSTGIYEPEYRLQVHAYGSCIPDVQQVAILRLDKETGEIEFKCWPYNAKDTVAFLAMAAAYNILFPYVEPKKKKGVE